VIWNHHFESHSTPLWWLRDRLGRCEAGPWRCWRRVVTAGILPACHRHRRSDLILLAMTLRQAYQRDPWMREWADRTTGANTMSESDRRCPRRN
jgi:hypothetical protein